MTIRNQQTHNGARANEHKGHEGREAGHVSQAGLQWGRIVAGAVLLELALIVVFVPLLSFTQAPWLLWLIAVGCFVFGFGVTRWALRKVRSRPVLHGTLIGVLATLIYLALGFAQPGGIGPVIDMYGPFLFVLGNVLRIAGCMVGGMGRK